MANKKVFLLGPGYVGREIIDLLLAEGKYDVTTIVRREAAGKELQKNGVTTHLGDLNDQELIKKLARESDIVFHTATADHIVSAQAILDGVKERAAQGLSTIYLHQSGASVLSSERDGNILSQKIYSDQKPEDIDALSDEAPHRPLLKVRKELGDRAKIFIMMPPIIYGSNKRYSRLSIQVPTLTRFAVRHKYSGYVGKGAAAWGVVHVQDVAQAYLIILHWLEQSPSRVGLEHPYFFCESGERTWHDVASVIGAGLHKAGMIDDPTPRVISEDYYGDLFGKFTPDVVGCNARNVAGRVRALGWKSSHLSLEDAFEQEELPVILQEKEFKGSSLALS